MLSLNIHRASPVPAYQQIRDQIVDLVDAGVLRPGDRLPPTRTLAPDLGVHRSTVVRAYDEVRALGYLEAEAGSYSTVRRRERLPTARAAAPAPAPDEVIDWREAGRTVEPDLGRHGDATAGQKLAPEGVIDLDRLAADPTLSPDDALRRCLGQVLAQSGSAVLDYAEAAGWRPLREVLAARMRRHGVALSADELVVTAGAQHGLDLVLRYLARPGDRVAVEAPTYGLLHLLLGVHGLQAVEVPMGERGMDLDCLERVLRDGGRGRRPRLVYTMPSFHNPTGITTDQTHRERLLLLCEEHRIPVVEDGFDEEMKYTGQAVLPIKSMDSRGVVLYVGTLSKVVFPGLRVGWLATPPGAVPALTGILYASNLSGNTLAQAAAARFCASGEFETYLRRVHRIYRGRMRALQAGLEEHMPAGVAWTRPRGGYTAWLTLPRGVSEADVVQRVEVAGVRVGAGSRHYQAPPPDPHLRLSISCTGEKAIRSACATLGAELRKILE